MIIFWLLSYAHHIGPSPVRLILLQLIASVMLIHLVDWHGKMQAARKLASIEKLEELYALADCRTSESRRQSGDR